MRLSDKEGHKLLEISSYFNMLPVFGQDGRKIEDSKKCNYNWFISNFLLEL